MADSAELSNPRVSRGFSFHLAPEGAKIPLLALLAAIVAYVIGLMWVGLILLAAAAFSAWFFRDPERVPPRLEGVVISGADGKVIEISEGPAPQIDGEHYRKVGVFMSPMNVHVNRVPVDGEVISVTHTPGQFRAAFSDYASQHNERTLIVMADRQGRRHAMVQIAGYLARRIICRLHPHEHVTQGERLGIIMFGSRVDHFLPPEYRVTVSLGQRVRAGESIIGELAQ